MAQRTWQEDLRDMLEVLEEEDVEHRLRIKLFNTHPEVFDLVCKRMATRLYSGMKEGRYE